MIRARYSDFQAQLARVAGVSGMSTADQRVMDYTNLAIFELMDEGDWPSLIARLQFKVTQPRIVVPAEFDRILYLTVNRNPVPMQSPWFEFIGDGWEVGDNAYATNPPDSGFLHRFVGVLDREQIYTFEDVPQDGNVYYPVIYGTVNEIPQGQTQRPVLILQGYDSAGNWIRTQSIVTNPGAWIDGMELPINGDTAPFATQGSVSISQVTGIQKPVTNGYVNLYYYCPATGASVYACNYTPYDTTPYYRSYKIPGMSCNGQISCVTARCRRRYTPIQQASDWLLINNLPALCAMLQAVYYREAKDLKNYGAYKQMAVDILRKEMKSYLGAQRTKPAITFGEGTGVRPNSQYVL